LNIKNKQFVVIGYSSNIAQDAMNEYSKENVIYGTFNSKNQDNNNNNIYLSQLDLQNEDNIKDFVDSIKNDLSEIVVVNFAAYKDDSLVVNQELDSWNRAFNINVSSNFLLSKYLLPLMIQKKWGRFIHISSERAIRGSVGSTAYSASKSALLGFSRSLAKEYARFGVTSNVISLGYFDSGLYKKLDKKMQKLFIDAVPSKKLGTTDNIYHAINFLVLSDYTNGSVITIDGCME
jgi:NAD(P)-dependent dehydrogenase (short-subunit alcohol dehydrogenase family)